ncbi:MAG TPA: hypothetical protein VJ019_08735 [Aestuariivirga sp.]|jgi:hypothetical protein|nr:hypothetical protein [Aestuariivirga sp.]
MIAPDKAGEPAVMEGGAMLKKFLMAAGLAAAFTLSSQVAEAKVKVYLGIGDSGYCYRHYDPFQCGGYGFYSRPRIYHSYPNFDDYDRYPDFYDRVSCKEARWIVRKRGFHDVKTTNCGGKYHVFIAKKRGGIFKVRVYSRNGRIHSIRAI